MLPEMVRQRLHTLLPLLNQAGPAGELLASRLAAMLDAPEDGPGSISSEEWRMAAEELLRRLPDLQRDVRSSVATVSQLLVGLTLPQSSEQPRDGGMWRLASQLGASVAGWVVEPSTSQMAHRVANAVLPGLERLTPWVRQLAETPGAHSAEEAHAPTTSSHPSTSGETMESTTEHPPGPTEAHDKPSEEDIDPWETGTLGRTGGA